MTNPFGEIKWIFNFRNASSRRNIFSVPSKPSFEFKFKLQASTRGWELFESKRKVRCQKGFDFLHFLSIHLTFISLRCDTKTVMSERLGSFEIQMLREIYCSLYFLPDLSC
jgi:hypothetical protein